MSRCFVIFLLMSVGSAGVSREIELDPLAQLTGQAMNSFHAGNYEKTLELTQLAIEYQSVDPRTYYYRGLTFLAKGDESTAKAYFEFGAFLEVERIDPNALNLADVEELETVNWSLERIQGPRRQLLESFRPRVRMMMRIARAYKAEQVATFRREFVNRLNATRIAREGVDGIRGRIVTIGGNPTRVIDLDETESGIRAIIGIPESEFQRVSNIELGVESEASWQYLAKQVEQYAHRYEARHIGSINEEDLQLEYDPYHDVLTDAINAAQGRQRSTNSQQLIFFPDTPSTSEERVWRLINQHEFRASMIGFNVTELQLRKPSGAVVRLSIDGLSSEDKSWLREQFPSYVPFRDKFVLERRAELRARQQLAQLKAQQRRDAQRAFSPPYTPSLSATQPSSRRAPSERSEKHPIIGTLSGGGAVWFNAQAKKYDKEGKTADAMAMRELRDVAITASLKSFFPNLSDIDLKLAQGVLSGALDGSFGAVSLAILKSEIARASPELVEKIEDWETLYKVYKVASGE